MMEVKDVLTDEEAVSPVIGVILMVAVTVILAAVIGTFVLGIGSQVTSDTPKVSFGFVYDNNDNGFNGNYDDNVTITHRGGDKVEASELSVKVGGEGTGSSGNLVEYEGWSSKVNAGDTAKYGEDGSNDVIRSGDTVQVIWEDSEGEGSAILGEDEVP